MEFQKAKIDYKELLSPNIENNPSKFLEILESIDSSTPTRESALIIKKAMAVHKNPILSFLLKKSFRLAAFKLKGAAFKISIDGLEKLLHSPDRLDDLALGIASINTAEAFMASDYFKTANWKEFPNEILPCFCIFFKNYGNSQDLDDLLELTRNPNPIVVAAAVEAIKRLDTGSLRSIIAPLMQSNNELKESEAFEQLYASNVNYDSSNISNESKEYYIENHDLILEKLKNSDSDREIIRILRLIKKYGNSDDSNAAKPFLNNENPEIVRATIKVLEKLDSEYLCLYLPQLLQDKNTKVRLTATRAFQSIDQDSVNNMVLSLLKSLNQKQRNIGITTAMLVDYFKIKDTLLEAFAKENNPELLDKMGLVFAANPYRELIRDVYFAHRMSKATLKNKREKIIELLSEKVSIFLGGTPWPKELIDEAVKAYEEYVNTNGSQPDNQPEQENKESVNNNSVKPSGFYKGFKPKENKQNDTLSTGNKKQSFVTKIGFKEGNKKSIASTIIWILVMVAWGLCIVAVIMKFF